MRNISRDAVGNLLDEVATAIIMPRFQNLRDDEISTKSSATDFVTIADQQAEEWLTPRLRALVDCPVIGEEAVAVNPALRDQAGSGLVWTVDPVDGTANFVKGVERFCVMVALVQDGVPLQSWVWNPVQRVLYHAVINGGAEMVSAGVATPLVRDERRDSFETLVGGGNSLGLEEPRKSMVRTRLRTLPGRRFIGSAGIQGCMLAAGNDDYMFHGFCTPWDHAPVDLICREAGCFAAMVADQAAYRTDIGGPFMIAANKAIWHHLVGTIWNDPFEGEVPETQSAL